MSCFTGVSGELTWVRAGNFNSSLKYVLVESLEQIDELGEVSEEGMCASCSLRWHMPTVRLKYLRKSAIRIGFLTSVLTKIHGRECLYD